MSIFLFYLDNNDANDGPPNDNEPAGHINLVEVEPSDDPAVNWEEQRAPLLENDGKYYRFADKIWKSIC